MSVATHCIPWDEGCDICNPPRRNWNPNNTPPQSGAPATGHFGLKKVGDYCLLCNGGSDGSHTPECPKIKREEKLTEAKKKLEEIAATIKRNREELSPDHPFHAIYFKLASLCGETIAGLNSSEAK